MVQHIGSKFSLPKNIPLFAVAVGRSWGFQILHGHTHSIEGSEAEMHSLCHTLSPPPILPMPLSDSFFFPFLCLPMHRDFVDHLLRENPPEETEFCV